MILWFMILKMYYTNSLTVLYQVRKRCWSRSVEHSYSIDLRSKNLFNKHANIYDTVFKKFFTSILYIEIQMQWKQRDKWIPQDIYLFMYMYTFWLLLHTISHKRPLNGNKCIYYHSCINIWVQSEYEWKKLSNDVCPHEVQ